MSPAELDDLVHRARRRDPAALDALFSAFQPRVYVLLLRLTRSREWAEDLLQETFLRVVRTLESYVHDGRFEAWLFRIAANLARDYSRQQRRRGPMHTLDGEPDQPGSLPLPVARDETPDAAMNRAEHGALLAAALERLPEADREILILRHYADMSFREIAELLGVPLGTALARAHRALGKLRADLAGHAGDEAEQPQVPAGSRPVTRKRNAFRETDHQPPLAGLPAADDPALAALERRLELDAARLLADLPAAPGGPRAAVERIRLRVLSEARDLRRAQCWAGLARLSGIAAALLVAVATAAWQPGRAPGGSAAASPLDEWAAALASSRDALIRLSGDEWLYAGGLDETIEDFERAVDSLDDLGT